MKGGRTAAVVLCWNDPDSVIVLLERLRSLGPAPDHVVVVDILHCLHGCFRSCRKFLRRHHVYRDRYRYAVRSHEVDNVLCVVHQIGFRERVADFAPCREHEGIGDSATDDKLVYLIGKLFQDRQLGGTLRPGNDGNQRPGRVVQRLTQRFQLGGK